MQARMQKALTLLVSNSFLFLKIVFAHTLMKWLPAAETVRRKKVRGVLIELSPGRDIHFKRMYYGFYEPLVTHAMARLLHQGDTFIDVGANMGYLTAIAAGLVGRQGQVHSFEPVREDFEKLKMLADMNPEYQIYCNQYGLGEREEFADMNVSNFWVGWNTLVAVAMADKDRKETVRVKMGRLDDYLLEHERTIGSVALIKIDVEGYEYYVLKGLERFFQSVAKKPPIICEVSPNYFRRLRLKLEDLIGYMNEYGYRAFSLIDLKTQVDLTSLKQSTDVLFRCDL